MAMMVARVAAVVAEMTKEDADEGAVTHKLSATTVVHWDIMHLSVWKCSRT